MWYTCIYVTWIGVDIGCCIIWCRDRLKEEKAALESTHTDMEDVKTKSLARATNAEVRLEGGCREILVGMYVGVGKVGSAWM